MPHFAHNRHALRSFVCLITGKHTTIKLHLFMLALLAAALALHIRWLNGTRRSPLEPVPWPDHPRDFGTDVNWLAIATTRPDDVVRLLKLDDVRRAQWREGIGRVTASQPDRQTVFVTAPAASLSRQRTFVVGLPLPMPIERNGIERCRNLLEGMSATFGEAEFFTMTEGLGLFAWVKAIDGKIVRAFAFGEHGVAWNEGALTRDERDLGLRPPKDTFGTSDRSQPTHRLELLTYPKKEHVMELSKRWSVSPFELSQSRKSTRGRGWLGRLKSKAV